LGTAAFLERKGLICIKKKINHLIENPMKSSLGLAVLCIVEVLALTFPEASLKCPTISTLSG